MADSDILAAIKSLQTHLESQLLATNTTLQKFMSSVESRFAALHNHPLPPPPPPPGNHAFRSMKMEVPRFDGTDPAGWIFRVEEFFNFHNTAEEARLQIVSFHMEGKAAAWFQWMKANHLLSTWPVFLHSVRHRFGGSLYDDPQGALSKLTQTSSVAEFQSEFEELMNKVEGISENLLISFFITGLKSDIRRELSFSKPQSLMEAFSRARAYEARLEDSQAELTWRIPTSIKATPVSVVPPSSPAITPSMPQLVQPTPPQLSSSIDGSRTTSPLLLPAPTAPTLPIKKFSLQELREKREKGICYNCDQKWSPGHKCRSKFLFLFGSDDGKGPPVDSPTSDLPLEETILGDIPSFHTLSGASFPNSMQLTGSILGHNLRVLVDSGSTHNFLQPSMAQLLNLSIQEIPPFRVLVGNDDYLVCKHLCSNVPLLIQGHKFVADFHLLNIEGPSLVLGIEWLRRLGQVTHDYAKQSMEFVWEGQTINFKGDTTPAQLNSFNQLRSMNATEVLNQNLDSYLWPTDEILIQSWDEPFMRATGENFEEFNSEFSNVHLEDKVKFEGGESVMMDEDGPVELGKQAMAQRMIHEEPKLEPKKLQPI